MTRIVYLGSEVPSNRKLLIEAGVTTFGWSFARALKRGFPTTKRYSFADYYPEGSVIVVHPGANEVRGAEAQTLAAAYLDFVLDHRDEVTAFTEFDSPHLPADLRARQREVWDEEDMECWAVYDGSGPDALLSLAQRYHEVAIPSSVLESDTSLSARTRSLSAVYDTVWHGLGVSTPENLRQVDFATASTLSWASPMMRGETIVWDGTRLARYSKDMKAQARPRYRAVILGAGLDYEAVMADDSKEVTRLAIWSYRQLERHMDRKKPGNPFTLVTGDGGGVGSSDEPGTEIVASDDSAVVNSGSMDRHPTRAPLRPREASERAFLPVMGVRTKRISETAVDGTETVREAPFLTSNGDSLRQCDTCFVASTCPAMAPASACAFSLPVEIRTKDQLLSLLATVVEMQGARVAFAKYAEDLNGGYPDPNTGMEIDRLFKIVGELKTLEDNREFERITLERSGRAGVLSSIFGDRAQILSDLPQAVDPALVIRGALED